MVEAGGEEPRGACFGDLQLRGSQGHCPARWGLQQLYACRLVAVESHLVPPAFVSPAPSPVTHLLIAAIVCHVHLESSVSDLK